jgi:hypothetical protein
VNERGSSEELQTRCQWRLLIRSWLTRQSGPPIRDTPIRKSKNTWVILCSPATLKCHTMPLVSSTFSESMIPATGESSCLTSVVVKESSSEVAWRYLTNSHGRSWSSLNISDHLPPRTEVRAFIVAHNEEAVERLALAENNNSRLFRVDRPFGPCSVHTHFLH